MAKVDTPEKNNNTLKSDLITVDSLKLRLSIDKVQILNESLNSHWIEVNELTGEIRTDKEFKDSAYYVKNQGISTRYALEKQPTKDKTVKQFLVIAVNAKMLGSLYFDGLTPENLIEVYNYLISQKVVSFSYKDFLNSECTDVDYKKDFICPDIDLLIKKLSSLTIQSNRKGEGFQMFNKENNKGIQWADRKTTSISKAPYIKIYSKHLDLISQSKEFRQTFLQDKEIKNLTRVEFTIKNKKHYRLYKVEDTTLKSVVSISQPILNTMLKTTIAKHTEKVIKPIKAKTDGKLSATDQKLINLVQMAIESKIGISELRRYYTMNLNKKTAIRTGVQIDNIWKTYFSKLTLTKEVVQVENWLKNVGIEFS